ncbi:MAG: NAD(P)H-dependent oxidoreductase subunit E [bacterium]|nr:NAD(P)H-dependent oxidoreductase subunit E [bacterium]
MAVATVTDLGKYEEARVFIDQYIIGEKALIGMLLDIQDEFNFLPQIVLTAIAEETGIPLARLYGVVTYYDGFSLTAQGRNHVKCCTGTACVVRGSRSIVTDLITELSIRPGEVTDDGAFSLEAVHCFGACAHGPILVTGEDYHGLVTSAKTREIIGELRRADEEAKK